VAQLFAESCNGHHKKSVSRTMMSIRPETSAHTPSTAAQIRVRGAAKRYGALEVFRGIEFQCRRAGDRCHCRPSGCGKTTLLRRGTGLGKALNSRCSFNPDRTGPCRPAGARHLGPA
jgi:ABC-type branched-subunit amino acid transport system ATPase component